MKLLMLPTKKRKKPMYQYRDLVYDEPPVLLAAVDEAGDEDVGDGAVGELCDTSGWVVTLGGDRGEGGDEGEWTGECGDGGVEGD